jgi:hypothetical protein
MSQWMTSTSARTSGVPNPGPTLPPEVSLAEYAVSTVASPQPAWRTLNIARERAFTGELRFATAPAIAVFVDGGSVYFAERHGDTPLGERLLAAGVVTPQQLERGVVRVGGAEHLGRLFDRDPDVDRDAVMVVVESSTEALVAELAAEVVAAVEVNPYRHHQSGVHRWFVAPIDVSLSRPVSDVAQVDRSVIDDLPGLPAPTSGVRIEWDQPDAGGLAPPGHAHAAAPPALGRLADAVPPADALRDVEPVDPSADLDAGIGAGDVSTDMGPDAASSAPDGSADDADAWLDDFQIVWPDGSEELAAPAPRRVTPLMPTTTVEVSATADETEVAAVDAIRVEPGAETRAEVSDDANVSFAMPQLRIDTPPGPGADVPDDVADAVRRALQAIEQAATQPRPLPQIDLAPITLPELRLPTLGESTETDAAQPMIERSAEPIEPTPSSVAPAPAPSDEQPADTAPTPSAAPPVDIAPAVEPATVATAAGSFAPPTADMSAESVYERLAAEQVAAEPAAAVPAPAPEPGQASVVFLDEEDADSSTRKGALRRLIGSLRRGD